MGNLMLLIHLVLLSQDDYDDDARTDHSSHSWDESASFVRGKYEEDKDGEG